MFGYLLIERIAYVPLIIRSNSVQTRWYIGAEMHALLRSMKLMVRVAVVVQRIRQAPLYSKLLQICVLIVH